MGLQHLSTVSQRAEHGLRQEKTERNEPVVLPAFVPASDLLWALFYVWLLSAFPFFFVVFPSMKCTEAEGKGRVRLGIRSVLEVLSVLHRKDERCMVFEPCFLNTEGDVLHINEPPSIKVRPGSREGAKSVV